MSIDTKKAVVGSESHGWKAIKADPKRVRKGVSLMEQALERDFCEERRRGSYLPKDWRSRRLQLVEITPQGVRVICGLPPPRRYGLPADAGVRFM